MIALIDNYDSFTFNLKHYFEISGQSVQVFRNDEVTLSDIERLQPDGLVLSPGPGTPDQAGISMAAIKQFQFSIPILGVCLGHQCIGQVFGSNIRQAREIMHGKTSEIFHTGKGIFGNIPSPFQAARYHSLIVGENDLSDEFIMDAWSNVATNSSREIMAIHHRTHPIFGVQFHPESIMTEHGLKIIENFVSKL